MKKRNVNENFTKKRTNKTKTKIILTEKLVPTKVLKNIKIVNKIKLPKKYIYTQKSAFRKNVFRK